MRILIVEDEMLVAMSMKINLEAYGHKVIGISPNESTFWKFMESDPDVILLDIQLKAKENGVKLAKKLRKHNPTIPVIFTTANTKKDMLRQTLDIDNSVVLNKPILFEDLLQELNTIESLDR